MKKEPQRHEQHRTAELSDLALETIAGGKDPNFGAPRTGAARAATGGRPIPPALPPSKQSSIRAERKRS